jgi:hypothetical protein
MKNDPFVDLVTALTRAIEADERLERQQVQPQPKRKNTKNIQLLNEVYRLTNVLRKVASFGRNTSLHTWSVKSFTNPNRKTFTVRQTLLHGMTCTCESFRYNSGLDYEGHCKHIREVLSDPNNASDLQYGQGAIEATKRLQAVAKNGLVG